jgi:hypothetical protein
MPYVLIRHKIANYAKWKRTVQAHAQWRKDSGEKALYACRGAKSANDVLVWCEWDSTANMKKFMGSAKLRAAMKQAGVVGKPQISFWDKLEDLTAH